MFDTYSPLPDNFLTTPFLIYMFCYYKKTPMKNFYGKFIQEKNPRWSPTIIIFTFKWYNFLNNQAKTYIMVAKYMIIALLDFLRTIHSTQHIWLFVINHVPCRYDLENKSEPFHFLYMKLFVINYTIILYIYLEKLNS